MGARFAIIGAARTGSNRLMAQLNAQSDIWCHGEILQKERCWVSGPPHWKKTFPNIEQELLALRKSDLPLFYERIYALSHGREHVGFKALFENNYNLELIRHVVGDCRSLKIVLIRQNVLAVYSSKKAAIQSGAWNPYRMRQMKRPLIEFVEAEFVELREGNSKHYNAVEDVLHDTGQGFLHFHYEYINDNARLSQLLSFIGAKPEPVTVSTPDVRGSSDILSRFSNPEVAERYLREHGLMHWAHEADSSTA